MTDNLQTIKIGFVPLVDCALLAIAKEKGFAKANGLNLDLFKEVSWANIRDKVYLGYLDGAQMLAGMPLAANLGLMPNSSEIVAPFVLGRNGNAITVSKSLYKEMEEFDSTLLDTLNLERCGAALKAVIEKRKKQGREILRFGMVFPFSCHNYHLRYWMAACGINPDVDVHLEVIPPPFMDQYLAEGGIDGFCVGEPWSSIAVAQDFGVIVATTSQIWAHCPEKLLGLRKTWVDENPIAFAGLIKALHQAQLWIDDEVNQLELATLLSDHAYLDVPAKIILRSLSGQIKVSKDRPAKRIEDFMIISGNGANFPSQEEARWIFDQMKRWGQVRGQEPDQAAMALSFSESNYIEILGKSMDTPYIPNISLFDND